MVRNGQAGSLFTSARGCTCCPDKCGNCKCQSQQEEEIPSIHDQGFLAEIQTTTSRQRPGPKQNQAQLDDVEAISLGQKGQEEGRR